MIHGLFTVPSPQGLLWSLCSRADLEGYWLADESDAASDLIRSVVIEEPDEENDFVPFVVRWPEGGELRDVPFYRQLRGAVGEPADQVRGRLVAGIADELRVDALVTVNQALLEPRMRASRVNAMPVEEGLAAIGLYLRNRGEFPLSEPQLIRFGAHLQLWTAVRSQLPAGWQWGSALVSHGQHIDRHGPALLFGSLHERMVRVLQQRDRLHVAVNGQQDNATARVATEALDYIMVNLVGAFDAAARAAHLATGLDPSGRHRAGWQKDQWRGELEASAPDLAGLFARGTHGAELFKIIRLLRNTVHGDGLQPIGVHAGGRPRQTLVALPEDDAEELHQSMSSLGGADDWGLVRLGGNRIQIEPRQLVERILPKAFDLLNDTLRLTPVHKLSGTQPNRVNSPPSDLRFGPGTRVRACLLLGLPLPQVEESEG
jgi:hypothetical protein